MSEDFSSVVDAVSRFSRGLHPPSTEDGLKHGGGGGTSGGMSDDWKASVDRQLEQLHTDVRHLLFGGIAAVVLIVGLIGGLYLRTDAKFEAADARLRGIEIEAAKSGGKLDQLLDRSVPAGPAK